MKEIILLVIADGLRQKNKLRIDEREGTKILVDEFEPLTIVSGLKQVYPDLLQLPLNRDNWGDYVIHDFNKSPHQFERKQVGEILSGMEHVEEQLSREMQAHPDASMTLLVEGVVEPVPNGTQIYQITTNGMVFRKGRTYDKIRFDRYEGFLTALDREGIRVWKTSSWQGTLEALCRFQKQADTPDHSIFQRYLKIPQFNPDPYVQLLMGLRYTDTDGKNKSAGIGEVLAQVLVAKWGTPWELFRQEADTIAEYTEGIGPVLAKRILQCVGR